MDKIVNPNPLADREKALENQWIKDKERQMAKEKAAKSQVGKSNTNQEEKTGQQKQ